MFNSVNDVVLAFVGHTTTKAWVPHDNNNNSSMAAVIVKRNDDSHMMTFGLNE